jgi:hypothetical protein
MAAGREHGQAYASQALVPCYWPRPMPRISGSAMPTGVHLSDGRVRSSTDFELFLAGLTIMALAAAAAVAAFVLLWGLEAVLPVPLTGLLIGALPGDLAAQYAPWNVLTNLLAFFVFLAVLRLSPLAGYHAAEHMTVAAIERFGYLDPEQVKTMPRAHPRCGTTLLAGLLPALLIAAPLGSRHPALAGVVLVGGWLVRRPVGYFLQQYFTTKPPTRKQLEMGLRSGQRILAGLAQGPRPPGSPAQRLWQRGFLQMAAGAILALWVESLVYEHLHLWLDWTR